MIPSIDRTWVELDRSATAHNTQKLATLIQQGAGHCAIVKSNAYGHGLEQMTALLSESGIRFFGVDSLDEAIAVRKIAPESEIIILGYTPSERFNELLRVDAIQTITNEDQLGELNDIAQKAQGKGRISLKLETGTQRQGIAKAQLPRILMTIRQKTFIEFTSVHSHFSDSESPKGEGFTHDQFNRFAELFKTIREKGFTPNYIHISSSAATTLFPELQGNVVRFGIMNYGLWPSVDVKRRNQISPRGIELQPVLSWRTRVVQVKDIASGIPVGYGRSFISDRPMRIAVLPVGYYDGYRRTYRDNAEVLIHGHRCRVLGGICMNMMMVDVSQIPQVKRDDVVTLVGRDGMHMITADDLAGWGKTINYEVVTQISPHLPRHIV
jgi:alanine racemase